MIAHAAEEDSNSASEAIVPPVSAVLNVSHESDVANLTRRVTELGNSLKSRLDLETKSAFATARKKPPATTAIDLSDKKWTVKFGGHVQLDYINWANADPAIIGSRSGRRRPISWQ